MTATVQSVSTTKQGTNSSGITATEPSGASQGDLLVALHVADSNSSWPLTPPSGWTVIGAGMNQCSAMLSYIDRGASAPALDFSNSGSETSVVHILRIDGHDAADPIGIFRVDSSDMDVPTFPDCGTSTDDSLHVVAYGANNATLADAYPASYTGHANDSSNTGGGQCCGGIASRAITQAQIIAGVDWGSTSVASVGFSVEINPDPPTPPGNGSSPVFEGYTWEIDSANDTDLVLQKPAGTVAGDLLVLLHMADGAAGGVTPPSGWTELIDTSNGVLCDFAVSYRIAGASEPSSYTSTTGNAQNHVGLLLRFSNVDAANPIDVSGTNAAGSDPVSPSVTTTVDNCLLVRAYAGDDANIADPGFPSSLYGLRNLASRYDGVGGSNCGGAALELLASAGASGTAVWPNNATLDNIGATIAIAPAASGYERSISDSVAVTDFIAAELVFGRFASDTATTTDAAATTIDYGRFASDTVAVADEAVGERVIVIADVVSVTDAVAREHDASRTVSDAVATTDAPITELEGQFNYDIDDTAAATDAVVVAVDYGRAVSDAVVATDAVAAEMEFERRAVDNHGATDAIEAGRELDRAVSDAVATTDATTREHDASRAASDTVAVTDATAIEAGAQVTANDTVDVTDAVTRELDASRSASDAVAVTDATLVGFDRSRAASDSVAATDAVAVELEFERSAADVAAVTDATARELDAARTISDAVVAVDDAQTGQEYLVTVADTANTTDAVATAIDYSRAIADAPAVTDAVAREHDASRSIGDTADVADATDAVAAADIEAADSVAATDVVAREAEFERSASDVASVTDAVAAELITPNVVISDTIEVTDVANGSLDVANAPADALDVVDAIEVVLTLGASASDAVAATDAVVVDILSLDPDAVAVTDAVVRSVEYNRAVADLVATNDLIIEGEPEVYGETIDGGVVVGGVFAHTVSPFGPVSASGGPDCVAPPVGFVVGTADQVSCTDSFRAGLECHIVIGDIVAVVEV